MKEKETFVYNKRGTYSFPAGIIYRRFDTVSGEGSDNKSRGSIDLTCNSWAACLARRDVIKLAMEEDHASAVK